MVSPLGVSLNSVRTLILVQTGVRLNMITQEGRPGLRVGRWIGGTGVRAAIIPDP